MRTTSQRLALAALATSCATFAAVGQVRLVYSDSFSLGQAQSTSRAFNANSLVGGAITTESVDSILTDVTIGQTQYDHAIVVGTTANDENFGLSSVVRTSGAAYVGVARRGEARAQIDFRAVTLSDTFNGGWFFGDSYGVASVHLVFEVDLDGGRASDFEAIADWNYEAHAETSCETFSPPMYEDSGRAEGSMNMNAPLLDAPGFEVERSSMPFGPPPFGQDHGQTRVRLVEIGGRSFVFVNLSIHASSSFSAPGVGSFEEDLVGSEFIGSVVLSIQSRGVTPACVADVDDGSGTGTPDGGVTIDDLLYYLGVFEQGSLAADVDDGSGSGTRDGGVTIDDLLYFLLRFEQGC